EIVQEKEEKTTNDTEVEPDKDNSMLDVTNIVPLINVDNEEDEITDEVFEFKEKGEREECSSKLKLTKTNRLLSLIKANPIDSKDTKVSFMNYRDDMVTYLHISRKESDEASSKGSSCISSRSSSCVSCGRVNSRKKTTKEETKRLISKAILQERGRMQAQISSQIQNAIDNAIPSLVDASVRSYMSGHILHVHPAQVQSSSVPEQQHQLYLAMKADPLLQQQDIAIWLALQMKFEKTQVPQTACRSSAVRTRDQDDPYDDAHLEGENSAKR
ncbi:hypothetical protein Tco_1161495, partial [Tanacetum coccineum]